MRFSSAIAISVGIHAVLGGALALYLRHVPSRITLAELDLSSVDLSFAETVEETAPAFSAPSAPAAPSLPKPQETPAPQRPQEEIRPNLLGDTILPVPKDFIEQIEPPKLSKHEKPVETAPISPAAPAPRQARVDAPPRPKRAIRPEYPKHARERGEEGDVILSLSVTAEGTVSSVAIATSSGHPDLDEAAVRAARAARFTPARLKDAPVASTARLTLSFCLK